MSKKKPNVASFLGAVARGSIKDRSIKKYYQVQKVGALGAGMKYVWRDVGKPHKTLEAASVAAAKEWKWLDGSFPCRVIHVTMEVFVTWDSTTHDKAGRELKE